MRVCVYVWTPRRRRLLPQFYAVVVVGGGRRSCDVSAPHKILIYFSAARFLNTQNRVLRTAQRPSVRLSRVLLHIYIAATVDHELQQILYVG